MTFREKLLALRARDHLTQTALATAVGVTRQAVYMWEKGQSYPEAETLLALRRLFGVSIDALLDDTISLSEKEAEIPARGSVATQTAAPRAASRPTKPALPAPEEEQVEEPYFEPFADTEAKTPSEKGKKTEPPAPAEGGSESRQEPLRAKVKPSGARRSGSILDLFGAFLRRRK